MSSHTTPPTDGPSPDGGHDADNTHKLSAAFDERKMNLFTGIDRTLPAVTKTCEQIYRMPGCQAGDPWMTLICDLRLGHLQDEHYDLRCDLWWSPNH